MAKASLTRKVESKRVPWARLFLAQGSVTICVSSALVVVLGLFCVFPYFEGYGRMRFPIGYYFLESWVNQEGEWRQCIFVPIIVIGLIYLRWGELMKIPVRGHTGWGLSILTFGFCLYWLGYAGQNNYLGYASTHITYSGLILLFLGPRWMKALIFPSLFLLYMWPMYFLDNVLAFPMRLFMSDGTHLLLNLIGCPNDQVGTAIISAADPVRDLVAGARFALDVADPCSGIRSLFAMLMISALYGYFIFGLGGEGKVGRREAIGEGLLGDGGDGDGRGAESGVFRVPNGVKMLMVFLASFPLVIVGNAGRILILVFGSIFLGPRIAVGTTENPSAFHEGAGYLVYLIELVGLLAVGWLLGKVGEIRFKGETSGFSRNLSGIGEEREKVERKRSEEW